MTPLVPFLAADAAPGRYVTTLDRLELPLFLGIHPPEVAARQRVFLSVQMVCDYPSTPDDRIEAVVDYDFLRDEILALARDRRFALQEVLCETVAALCWRFPPVVAVEVRSEKPDIYPDAAIGCRIFRKRPVS